MMSENKIERFRFSYNYGDYDDTETFETTVEFKCEESHISDVIEKFEQFLRGCGFCFSGEIVQVDFKKYDLVERKPITVTKNADQGINITNDGNIYPPGQEKRSSDRGPYSAYPVEGIDAWNRGQTAV
jgi:hypothetical protein